MTTISTVPFSLRLDSEIRDQLEEESVRTDRSSSYIAAQAIKEYLEQRVRKQKAINDAVAAANAGEFISQQAMGEWVDSWGTSQELPLPEPVSKRIKNLSS